MGLKNLREKNHSIDFNVVNPSNNTFNKQKNIITIFVNETKCIFEKNLKEKNHSKIDSKNDSKSDSRTKQKQTKNKSHLGAVSPQRLVLQLLTQSGV
jgi:zona occludens toxin (predicted ATPase)